MLPDRILVVDDDLSMRQMLSILLERSGYTVETAASAEEALGQIEDNWPDLVMTDLNMPGGDGAVLARRVRSRSGVPVLLTTAMDEASIAASGLDVLGGVQVLRKPYAPARLREAIESALAAPVQPLMASLESA